ncbi:hypothetical protein, partial [Phenylobacterium sp.]|uniref:hypothetical protein n=1 Tax=Phenylobacterium sp. TaxID=1871053 RepID=UPI002F3FB4F9
MAANDCMTLDCAETDAALRRRETVRRQRRGYAFAGVATLVLTAVAPMAARAQSIGGPFTPGGHPLSVGLQFQTLFDSNTARGNDLAAAIRGLKQEDVIYTPSINVNYSSPNSREGVALRAFAGYDFYQNNTILSREHIDLSAAGNATFGRCQVGAQVAYDRGQSGLEDLTLL